MRGSVKEGLECLLLCMKGASLCRNYRAVRRLRRGVGTRSDPSFTEVTDYQSPVCIGGTRD